MDSLTLDQFKEALPASMKKSVNKELVSHVNSTLSDPDMYETYRENLLSYTRVMQEGKFKLSSYIDAVKFCSHRIAGATNKEAFSITFPQKISGWTAKGVDSKDIASYISAYSKSKLVTLIMGQAIIPTHILNQDLFQKAINTQAELMTHAVSEKVRCDAANSLLTHLKPPETQKIELDVNHKEDSSISELRKTTMALAAQQRQMIESGAMNAQEIAHSKIIQGETVDDPV